MTRSPNTSRVLRRGLAGAGWVMVWLGVVVVLFVAWQWWGTGWLESHSQQVLRRELAHVLPPGAAEKSEQVLHQSGPKRHADPSLQVAPSAPTPATGEPIGTIQIPSIGLDQVVEQGVQAAQLAQGPGHYPGTPLPGEGGNVGIAGHRTTYAHPFYNLDQVLPGDEIVFTTAQGVFVYWATGQSVVAPTDATVLDPSIGPELTLTTCNPRYSAATRLVVTAALESSHLFPAATAAPAARHVHEPEPKRNPRDVGLRSSLTPAVGTVAKGRIAAATVLAAAALGSAISVWLLGRRRRRRRWLIYLPGGLVALVVLFMFFIALDPLLPPML